MAPPSFTKIWQFNVNNVQIPYGNLEWHQRLLLNIKNAFIGFASNPWTVAGCGDGTGASGMAVGDLWSVYADIIWGTGTHSWIVLENVDGLQICIDPKYSTAYNCDFYMSSGGLYIGGSSSAKPTATDEIQFNSSIWLGREQSTPTLNHIWHMWHSEDGEVTRVVFFRNDVANAMWRFEKFQDPRAGHVVPYGCGIRAGYIQDWQLTVAAQEDNPVMRSDHSGLDMAINCTGIGRTNANLVERADLVVAEEIDGEPVFTEVGYFSQTGGGRGPKGKAFDQWWGQYQLVFSGDTYPNDPNAREFVQMGHLVFPWTGDSTVPLTH